MLINQRFLKENNRSAQIVMDDYKQMLDLLGELAWDVNASAEDKRYFAKAMVELAYKKSAFDTSNKIFLSGLLSTPLGAPAVH